MIDVPKVKSSSAMATQAQSKSSSRPGQVHRVTSVAALAHILQGRREEVRHNDPPIDIADVEAVSQALNALQPDQSPLILLQSTIATFLAAPGPVIRYVTNSAPCAHD